MSERIIIEIDDTQLQVALALTHELSNVSKKITRGKSLDLALPSINRELRVMLGQLPGMRNVVQLYFLVRRQERAYRIATDASIKPELGMMPLLLGTLANVLILWGQVKIALDRLKRQEDEFKNFVMKTRNLTLEEFDRERVLWKYYLKGQP